MMIRSFLDNNATTKPAPEVVAAMLPYLTELYPNPSSIAGQALGIGNAMSDAKRALARLLGSVDLADAFVLTSGASEANSWAITAADRRASSSHLVTTAVEHASVLAACRGASSKGHDLSILPVDSEGLVRIEDLAAAIRPDTALVSIMLANNETGAIQPIGELAAIVRERAPTALIHCDATQAVGKIPVNLAEALWEIDLLSLSAHKFHGPKGVGALYIRPGVELDPLIYGEQERGLRGGTLNAATAAGLAKAAEIAEERLDAMARIADLRNLLEEKLATQVAGVHFNARPVPRLPNTSSITIDGVDADALVDALAFREIYIATGSACSAGSQAPSHVLTAMGLSYEQATSTVRVSLSHETTQDELRLALSALVDCIVKARG
jgi:cysteine desulfurase